jgi:hypothetical protein
MFKKLFNRSKATSSAEPLPTAPMPPTTTSVPPKEKHLDVFREEWDARWETAHDVVEGNGGNTDWAAWTDAVEEEDKSFAPTVPMPIDLK